MSLLGIKDGPKVDKEATEIERLEARNKILKKHADKSWPPRGEIVFKGATMRYRPTLEPSVKDLNFTVQPCMKVGIVGRTGAGKSSILQALFRLCELCDGQIIIDGQDIKEIGLHLLRKGIAYIPQLPFLLQGTIRKNLDPFDECTLE